MTNALPVYKYFLVGPGPRPPFRQVAEHLWGKNYEIDSEGDSHPDPKTNAWTWLWMESREHSDQTVNIEPVNHEPELALCISSENQDLALRAATFLQREAGGELRMTWPLPDGWEPWG